MKWPVLRRTAFNSLTTWPLTCGTRNDSTVQSNPKVLVDEAASVDSSRMIPSQTSDAHQFLARLGNEGLSKRMRSTSGPAPTWVGCWCCAETLLDTIVGGLAGDHDVVDVAFTQASPADANKPRLLLQLGDGGAADISHAALDAAD